MPARSRSNPLLVKDDVGKAKASCYNLPGEDFAYGRPDIPDFEGAREVTMQWVSAQQQTREEVQVQDFQKLNKRAIKAKVSDAKTLATFRKEMNFPLEQTNTSAIAPKVYPSEVVPSFTYGKKTRPSTPIAQVISNQFGAEYEAALGEIYDHYEDKKQMAGQATKIRTTKAAEGHAKKVMQPTAAKDLSKFKLSKFANVKGKLVLPGPNDKAKAQAAAADAQAADTAA